jgi:hypothetical protein
MGSNQRPKFSKKEPKPSLKLGDLEDDVDDRADLEERPPCRQNTNVFDLEDNFYPVSPRQKFNGFIKDNGRSARGEIRPPSRHKTPPKAVGLELPPKRVSGEFIPVEHMFQAEESGSEVENESFSNTMPVNFSEGEKRKKSAAGREGENGEGKLRVKPKSAKGKKSEKVSIRVWSAANKGKKIMMDVPIIVTKKEKNSLSFSNSRRERLKTDEEKKEGSIEEKRKTYFKKNMDKRAQSSNNKPKAMNLPFQTSLEPEFLNLFARNEDFNF